MNPAMKGPLHVLVALILAAAPVTASQQERGLQRTPTFEIPSKLTFRVELESPADPFTEDSWMEVSAKLSVAEQSIYMEWERLRKNGQVNMPSPGLVLETKSFKQRDLSKKANRQITFTIPVRGELLERFRKSKQNPQAIWLSSVVTVREGKHKEFVNSDVSPFWDLRHFIDQVGNLKLMINSDGRLIWFSGVGKPVTLPNKPIRPVPE